MAYSKIQRQDENKTLGTGGLAGNAEQGVDTASQSSGMNKSAAGASGGFTNIQDYMNANKGDTTNQNYLNQKADTQIGNAVNQMNTNVSNLPQLPTNQIPAANETALNNLLGQNDYASAKTYVTAPNFNFAPTEQELPGIANPTANLTGDLSSVMNYIGEIKPQSQQYTPGMQKFDEMLLGQDKGFPGQFAANKQAQYKQQVEDPYGALKTAREKTKQDTQAEATKNVADWQNQFKTYMGGQEKTINENLKKQQDKYNADKAAYDKAMAEQMTQNYSNYISGFDPSIMPSRETAGYAAGLDPLDYNAISQILGYGSSLGELKPYDQSLILTPPGINLGLPGAELPQQTPATGQQPKKTPYGTPDYSWQ